MKRFGSLIMTFMLLFALTACGTQEQPGAEAAPEETVEVHVGSLKGPTSIGLLPLMQPQEEQNSVNYSFTMETQADALLPKMISGELDIALVPANLAAVLYNKTQGGIAVIDINTLGVLYMVSADDGIRSVADLQDRTIYTTGKGTTPEYVLRHILEENGVSAEIEFCSEASEVAAVISEHHVDIGLLPQPFATAALKKDAMLGVVLDMTEEWDKLDGDSALVTGVTVVRREFLEAHPEAVRQFVEDHRNSSELAKSDPAKTAEYMVSAGILDNAQFAEQAIPYCNLVCIDGSEMKAKLSGYLAVLFEADPASVGGAVPGEDFYYIAR